MDKIVLKKEELDQLKQFVVRKGFREPGVLLEILDHFACKVEEELEAKPSLGLEQAMENAHRSFGVSGFYPLAKTFYEQVQLRYNRLYRAVQKQVLKQASFWFFVTAAIGVYLPLYLICARSGYHHVLGVNDANALVMLSFLAATLYEWNLRRKFKGDAFLGAVQEVGAWPVFLLIFAFGTTGNSIAFAVLAFNTGIVIAGTLVFMARSRMFSAALEEQAGFGRAVADG